MLECVQQGGTAALRNNKIKKFSKSAFRFSRRYFSLLVPESRSCDEKRLFHCCCFVFSGARRASLSLY